MRTQSLLFKGLITSLIALIDLGFAQKQSKKDFLDALIRQKAPCATYHDSEVKSEEIGIRDGTNHQLLVDKNGFITVVPHVEYINGRPATSHAQVVELFEHAETIMGPKFKFKIEQLRPIDAEFNYGEVVSLHDGDDVVLLNKWRAQESDKKKLHVGFLENLKYFCGVATFPFSREQGIFIATRQSCRDDVGFLDPHLLVHELGHFFNLKHTHHGNGFNQGWREQVNRKPQNCAYYGDGFCSTPADPGLNFYLDYVSILGLRNCQFINDGEDSELIKDDEDQAYANVDVANIMSYAPDTCVWRLTDEQKTALDQGFLYRAVFEDGQIDPSVHNPDFFIAVDPNPTRPGDEVRVLFSQEHAEKTWFDDGNLFPGDLLIWTMDVEVRPAASPKSLPPLTVWKLYSYAFHKDAGVTYQTVVISPDWKPGVYHLSLPNSDLPPYRLILLGEGQIKERDENAVLTLAPNPVKAGSTLNIAFSNEHVQKDVFRVHVFNSMGQNVATWDLKAAVAKVEGDTVHAIVNIPGHFSPGMYFLKAEKVKGPATKVVVF